MKAFTAISLTSIGLIMVDIDGAYYWAIAGLIAGALAFIFGQLGLTNKLTKLARRKLYFDFGASFCSGMIVIPISLELLPGWGVPVSGPMILFVCGISMAFGYKIRPTIAMLWDGFIEAFLKSRGWEKTDTPDNKGGDDD